MAKPSPVPKAISPDSPPPKARQIPKELLKTPVSPVAHNGVPKTYILYFAQEPLKGARPKDRHQRIAGIGLIFTGSPIPAHLFSEQLFHFIFGGLFVREAL